MAEIFPQGVELRDIDDIPATRNAIFNRTLDSFKGIQPVKNQRYTLSLGNVRYTGPEAYSHDDENRALLEGRSLGRRLVGSWQLHDNKTNQLVDRRDSTLASVPYLSSLGTFINNGSEYGVSSQMRLMPGIFARRKQSGELESHINVAKGFGHRYQLDPASGVFRIDVGQAAMPLLPLLKALGATDDQIRTEWGNDLWTANAKKQDPTVLRKLYQKIYANRQPPEEEGDLRTAIKNAFDGIEVDPEVTKRTLGAAYPKLTPEAILATTRKLIAINKGEADTDDRDAMYYQRVVGPEDIFAERLKYSRSALNQALWKATNASSLKRLPPNLFDRTIKGAVLDSGLGSLLEEVNPGEILDSRHKLTRMGAGGITNADSVPDASRAIQPTQYGFVDLVHTPESGRVGVEGRLTVQTKKGNDGRIYSRFKNVRTGDTHWMSPQDLADKVLSFPQELETGEEYVRGLEGGRLKYVPRNKVDFVLNHMTEAFGPLANTVPLKRGSAGQRASMGSRMQTQAVSLTNGEAPFVQSLIPGEDRSFEQKYGRNLGAVFADVDGTVANILPNEIHVRGADGKLTKHPIYANRLFNRKSYLHNTPVVQLGQEVKAGQALAKSNYTDKDGTSALGLNTRVMYIPNGFNYEDASVISESLAKRMGAEQAYQHTLDKGLAGLEVSRKKFISIYPGRFNKKQLENFDEDGVIRPGTKVNYEDPLILAVNQATGGPRIGKRKSSFRDASVTWDHHTEGVVTNVVKTKNGVNVVVRGQEPVRVGDKLCYDSETEVLTHSGWKPIAEVRKEDAVATLDPQTGVFNYLNPATVHRFDHSGRMYRLKTTQVDLLVTDNHKLYAEKRNKNQYELIEARQLFGRRYRLKKNAEWSGESPPSFEFPGLQVKAGQSGRGIRTIPPLIVSTRSFLTLLGMFLSEGSTFCQPGGNFGIDICQVKPGNRKQLLDELTSLGLKFNEHSRKTKIRIYGLQLYKYFSQFGKSKDKFIPPEVFDWSSTDLKTLYKWLMWGDGGASGSSHSYFTSSKRLADDFQRLLLHIGYSGSVESEAACVERIKGKLCNVGERFFVRIYRNKNRPTINHGHIKKQNGQLEGWQEFNGSVYCVTMPRHHVIYVRRRGKTVWCGNSGRFGDKGVVSQILSDDQMPVAADGKPAEMLLNPAGLISRGNPSQKIEAALGKIAAMTGQPFKVEDFSTIPDMEAWAEEQLRKHNLDFEETVTDPATGRKIKNIATGNRFIMRLHHSAEGKAQGRGLGTYGADETPTKGGYSGCFVGSQKIVTIRGPKRISEICEKQLGIHVRTFSEQLQEWVYRPVTDWFCYRSPVNNVLTIETEGGPCEKESRTDRTRSVMHITKNHTVFAADGRSKSAGEVRPGDELVTWGEQPTADQWAFLYGTMLGDATSDKFSLSVEHSLKLANYVSWKRQALAGLLPGQCDATHTHGPDCSLKSLRNTRISSRVLWIRQSHVCQRLHREFYVGDDGSKQVTAELLDQLNGISAAVWFLDDGSCGNRAKKKGQVKLQGNIATHGFNRESAELLADWLSKRYCELCSVNSHGAIYLSHGMCEALAVEVAKYVPAWAIPTSKRWLKSRVLQLQESQPAVFDNKSRLGKVPLRVVDVRPYKPDKAVDEVNVYDFTVDDTHTYVAGHALVSNSKRVGMLDLNAILSHGAFKVARDASVIRGQASPESWRQFMSGHYMPPPKVSHVYEKFMSELQGSGIHPFRQGSKIQLMAMTNADVSELAADREIKSGETVNWHADDMKPIANGLFDEKLTGGVGGKKWSYIKLPEPLPNPVMADPIKKILGLTEKQYEDILAGRASPLEKGGAGPVVGTYTGPQAIAERLDKLDLDKEIAKASAEIKGTRKTARDAALKRQGFLKAAKAVGRHPREWMVDRVPVMPPIFRPISKMQTGTPLVADANYLYHDLLDAKDSYTAINGRVDDVSEERLAVYKAFKALTGLGDPVKPQTVEQGVKGILKNLIGSSPKYGRMQRQLLGSTVDLVGRAVITPNPNLDIDQVGLPEEEAWELYSPFITRRLVRSGMSHLAAAEAVKQKKPVAKKAMLSEMDSRPVFINRAPVLHRFGVMAFKPVLAKGKTLQIPPQLTSGFGADFDGDTMQFHVIKDDDAAAEALDKMLPSRNLFSPATFKAHMLPSQEYIAGMFHLSTAKKDHGSPKIFQNRAALLDAIKRNLVDDDDEIQVFDS